MPTDYVSNQASECLKQNLEIIMKLWGERASKEILAARHQQSLALRDSLPEYISQLSDALSTTIDRTAARIKADQIDSARISKRHGRVRAESSSYTIDQLIFEYRILRQVICDVLEEKMVLSPVEREVIVCSIEQAVNDAATQFSDSLHDYQARFTHALAHDLRGPITSAKMGAQLIPIHSEDRDYCVKIANRISHNLNRIDSMIQDLLDAGRVRAGEKLTLDFETCDLEIIARQIIGELNDIYLHRFVLHSQGPCLGWWNARGLVRTLENLATNAIKYGAPDAPITVRIVRRPESVEITVHNHGKSIPPDEQASLFEPFRRLRGTEKTIGWGLGLAAVKGIVESHHGRISIRSEEGQGTTVAIELPSF
jgi:signal transduction histidine kinase